MAPLFGGRRDISLFRGLNRELINRIITSPIDLFKPALEDTTENIYGEATDKVWLPPVRIGCRIEYPEKEMPYNEAGIMDVKQNPIFYLLRDDLIKASIKVEVGDIIHWDDKYWEVDRLVDTTMFMSKDPDTQKEVMHEYEPSHWGWKYSIACYTLLSRRNRISMEKTRSGGKNRGKLPDSLY